MSFDTNSRTVEIGTGSIAHLPQFDLTPIRVRVARDHSELTSDQLDDLELRYLQFLLLCKNESNVRHEPDIDVDWYWHAHILHTKRYAEDCRRYFGYFLHHEPNETSGELNCNSDNGCGAVFS